MTRSVVYAALATASIALAVPSAVAQQLDDERQPSRWRAALSTDPLDIDLRTKDPGVNGSLFGTLARDWKRASSPLGLRAMLLLGADLPRGYYMSEFDCVGGCRVDQHRQYAGALAAATMTWSRSRSFQPYVLAGPGLFIERSGTTLTRQCATSSGGCSTSPFTSFPSPATGRASLGVWGGVGVDFALRGRRFFVEQTVHSLDVGRLDHVIRPLSFGMRW